MFFRATMDAMSHVSRVYWILGSVIAAVYVCAFFYITLFDNGAFSDNGYPVHNGGDSYEYSQLAKNLTDYGVFSLDKTLKVPEMFRSPGYSFFLMPFYAVDHTFYLAIFAQIFLVIGSAFLIYVIGKKFLPLSWAFVVALFYALDPTTIFYSLTVLSDTLFVFLLLFSVYLLFIKETRGLPEYALSGFLLGFASLVRSAGEYLIFIIALCALFEALKRIGWKRAAFSVVLLVVSAYFVMAPWYARNYQESGVLSLANTGPYTVLLFDVKDFEVRLHGVPSAVFDTEVRERLHVESLDELRNIKYASGMMQIAKEKIFADPVQYGVYHLFGSLNLFLGSSIRDVTTNLPKAEEALTSLGLISDNKINVKELFATNPLGAMWYAVLSEPLFTFERLLRLAGLLLAGYVTVYALVTRRISPLFVLMVLVVAYTALVVGPVSYPRYRLPLEPFLYLITACGFLSLSWKTKGTSDRIHKS